MKRRKLSISISEPIARFIEDYRGKHNPKTNSEVMERALKLLRKRELERAYGEAASEIDPAWDATPANRLADDDWS